MDLNYFRGSSKSSGREVGRLLIRIGEGRFRAVFLPFGSSSWGIGRQKMSRRLWRRLEGSGPLMRRRGGQSEK